MKDTVKIYYTLFLMLQKLSKLTIRIRNLNGGFGCGFFLGPNLIELGFRIRIAITRIYIGKLEEKFNQMLNPRINP